MEYMFHFADSMDKIPLMSSPIGSDGTKMPFNWPYINSWNGIHVTVNARCTKGNCASIQRIEVIHLQMQLIINLAISRTRWSCCQVEKFGLGYN